jgi:hypothetical protein
MAFATALAGAGRAISAAYAGYSTTNGSVYGGGTVGTFSATTYHQYRSQHAQQLAQAQTNADFASLRAEGELNLQRLEQTILKDHTVLPGEWYGGTIVLEVPPRGAGDITEYTISVRFGGEVHEFQVRQTPT